MPHRAPVIATLMLWGWASQLVAGDSPPREAVEWIHRGAPECDNPEEMALIAFERIWFHPGPTKHVEQERLPDGSTVVVVTPDHGAGNCHQVSEYHFEPVDGRCLLRFVSLGPATQYLVEEPKLNGRYQVEQFLCTATGGRFDRWIRTRWFWSEESYRRAFETRMDMPERRLWAEENRAAYESAERSSASARE